MAQENELSAEKVAHLDTADETETVEIDHDEIDARFGRARVDLITGRHGVIRATDSWHDEEPVLWDMIKAKFWGYARWVAFSMLMAPVVFWFISRR